MTDRLLPSTYRLRHRCTVRPSTGPPVRFFYFVLLLTSIPIPPIPPIPLLSLLPSSYIYQYRQTSNRRDYVPEIVIVQGNSCSRPITSGEGMANNNSAAPYSSSSAPASSSSSMPPRPPPQPSAASSSSSVATIGRECAKCLSYLTRALDGGTATASSSSRPATLLRALGVISPIDGRRTNIAENNENGSGVDRGSNSSSNNKIYELTPNRRGVMIRLEDHHAHNKYNNNSSSNEGTANVENVRDSQHRESMVMVGSSGDNSHQQQKQPQHKEPIHRRLSNAASQLASNITSGQNNNTGIVLTTSPLSSSSPSSHNASTKDSSITTITIECSPCGSDTRAEASARAYVRGPDPLGIVLCSNRLASQREIEEVLVHELVHIYDVHVRQMDLRDCKQLAYSEVRAAREAECGNR